MTFEEYGVWMNSTKVYPVHARVMYPALALTEEVGEAVGIISKRLRDKPREVIGESGTAYLSPADLVLDEAERAHMLDELGDVLWEWAALATDLGFSLEQIVARNIEKLESRKKRGVLHGKGGTR